MLKVLTIDNHEAFLRQVSKKVGFNDPDLDKNINDIIEWSMENDKNYAMAAIQFGINKRIVFIKSTMPNDPTPNSRILMINPEIISKEGKTEFWEACASGGDNFALVERPYKIVVKYQDKKAQVHTKEFEGFSATVISHELDHLDGIFHMDRAKKIIQLSPEERVEFRKNNPYKIILNNIFIIQRKNKKEKGFTNFILKIR